MRRDVQPLRKEMIKRDPFCVECGETNQSLLTIDHIVPIAKGGTNDESNLRVLCILCNDEKGAK